MASDHRDLRRERIFLEKATPDMAMFKGLAEFNENSGDDIQKLRETTEFGGAGISNQ